MRPYVRRSPLPLLAVGALFSGAALVAHITVGISLLLALALSGGVVVVAATMVWRRASPAGRIALARSAAVGACAGMIATAAYDVSKYALSRLDPSPYNPFEAIGVFGALLAGVAATPLARYAAGLTYHLFNGTAFGVSFCLLLGRRGAVAGVAWGLGLETLQLTLYPGWLDVRLYREFAQISALGHVVYGAVLGAGCRYGLERVLPSRRVEPRAPVAGR